MLDPFLLLLFPQPFSTCYLLLPPIYPESLSVHGLGPVLLSSAHPLWPWSVELFPRWAGFSFPSVPPIHSCSSILRNTWIWFQSKSFNAPTLGHHHLQKNIPTPQSSLWSFLQTALLPLAPLNRYLTYTELLSRSIYYPPAQTHADNSDGTVPGPFLSHSWISSYSLKDHVSAHE